jgi:dTDP-glucose 4,6-dehydratase
VQRQPDISKAKGLFGWTPKIDLETGLKLSLEYFRSCVEVAA